MLMQQMRRQFLRKKKQSVPLLKNFLIHTFPWRGGMEMLQKKNSILLYGMNCINHVWHVVPAPLYVLPASAMTLKTMIQAMA